MGMAERIKERRKIMGYTQTELGEKIGLQASAIAKYENGRVENIKRSTIANMAKVLECSPSYLMGLDNTSSTIGIKIKECREKLGLTQEELARLVGYKSKSSINKIEMGINDIPQLKVLEFSDVLNTTPAYLMGYDDPFSESSAVLHAKMAKDAYFQRLYFYWGLLSDAGKDKLVEYATDLSKIYSIDATPDIENPDDDRRF